MRRRRRGLEEQAAGLLRTFGLVGDEPARRPSRPARAPPAGRSAPRSTRAKPGPRATANSQRRRRGPDARRPRHPRLRQPVGLAGGHPARGPDLRRARGGPGLRGRAPRPQDHPQQGRPAPGVTAVPAPHEAAPHGHAAGRPARQSRPSSRPRPPRRSAGRRAGRCGRAASAARATRGPSCAAALASPDHEVAVGTLDGTVDRLRRGARRARWRDGGLLGVIDDIYVDPGARAVGVGEALMDHLLAWCRAQGCFGVDSLALPGDRADQELLRVVRPGGAGDRRPPAAGVTACRRPARSGRRCAPAPWRWTTAGCCWCGGRPAAAGGHRGRCRAAGSSRASGARDAVVRELREETGLRAGLRPASWAGPSGSSADAPLRDPRLPGRRCWTRPARRWPATTPPRSPGCPSPRSPPWPWSPGLAEFLADHGIVAVERGLALGGSHVAGQRSWRRAVQHWAHPGPLGQRHVQARALSGPSTGAGASR